MKYTLFVIARDLCYAGCDVERSLAVADAVKPGYRWVNVAWPFQYFFIWIEAGAGMVSGGPYRLQILKYP